MRQETIDTLHREHCSLVVETANGLHLFYKKGVRDLENLLDHNPTLLSGSSVADKVVGKAAASIMAVGKVHELYADVLSRKALPILNQAGISYTCGTLVDRIVIPEGDTRCPLEEIASDATTAEEVVARLRQHFEKMQKIKDQKIR